MCIRDRHSLIGVGFLAATFLVSPFLPDDKVDTFNEVCKNTEQNMTLLDDIEDTLGTEEHNKPLYGVAKIAWPFIISGTWCMVFSCGFVILGK